MRARLAGSRRLLAGVLLAVSFIGAPFVIEHEARAAERTFPISGLTCPFGSYVAGFKVRSGAWVDKIGIMCTTFDGSTFAFGPAFDPGLPMFGGEGGVESAVLCPSGTAIFRAFVTHTRPPGWEINDRVVDNVVFNCGRTHPNLKPEFVSFSVINTDGDTTSDGDMIREVVDKAPGMDGPVSTDVEVLDCPNVNDFAVGVSGETYAKYVAFIAFPCMGAEPMGSISQPLTRQAPSPPPQGPIDTSSGAASFPLGVGSGAPINVDCSQGEALVGLQAQGTAYIDQVQIHCARFDGSVGTGPLGHRGTLGSSNGPVKAADCPSPSVVVAGDGDTSSFQNLVTRLSLRCSGGGATPYLGATAPVNMQTWTHHVITCGPGNVAVGIYGWLNADHTLKSVGFRCTAMSAFAGGATRPYAHRHALPNVTTTPDRLSTNRMGSPITQTLSVMCKSLGQECSPAGIVVVPPDIAWSVQVTPSPAHCSQVGFVVRADGAPIGRIGPRAPGQSTPDWNVPSGAAELEITALGYPGGCNNGRLGSWKADVTLTPR